MAIEDKEHTVIFERMSLESQEKYRVLKDNIHKIKLDIQEIKFGLINPELTLPKETREILDSIEKEICDIIISVATKEKFDLILNASVPVPFGYPNKYKQNALHNVGPIGIDQAVLYSLLSEKITRNEEKCDAKLRFKEWVSKISYPEIQDYLPIKPYPLTIYGGIDILPQSLKLLYDRYELDQKIYSTLIETIIELGETNK